MEKQWKIKKYMKQVSPGAEIFESSDFDIESGENRGLGSDKKQPNLMNFLRKIDQMSIDVMEKYITDHKHLLEVQNKAKITLFEDVYIICEYRRNFQALKKDRTKVVDSLCDKLQTVLKRSKVTIKERMGKKLSRCSVEDVLEAIKDKKDIAFDKEKPKKIILASNDNVGNAKPQASVKSQPTNGVMLAENEIMVPSKKLQREINPERMYNYGTKKLKERIYIYANLQKNIMLNFTESRFEEMKEKFGISLPLITKKTEEANQRNEESSESKRQEARQASQPQAIQPNLSEKELYTFIDNIKEKAVNVLNECNETESAQKREELKGYLETIQLLQEKLNNSQCSTKTKTLQQDISSEVSADRQNRKEELRNTTSKKTTANSPRNDQKLQDEQNSKLLFKLSNNVKYLETLKSNPDLIQEYIWEQQEDNILFCFKFNPDAYRTEMICLLRYKPRILVIERMKFLNLEVDFTLTDHINNLDSRKTEKVEPVAQELMEIE